MLACHYGGYKGLGVAEIYGPSQERIGLITCVLGHSINAMVK